MYEYPELESPIIPNGEYGLFFANEHAEEVKEEMNDKVIEAVTDEIFVNQSACESDFSGTEGHKQDSSVVINNGNRYLVITHNIMNVKQFLIL